MTRPATLRARVRGGLALILVLFLLAAPLAGCGGKEAKGGRYYCPMHPTYTSERVGDCPICNMKLVPIDMDREQAAKLHAAESPGHEGHAAGAPATGKPLYACPMHPEVTSDDPKARCPKCGMDLEQVPDARRGGTAAPAPAAAAAGAQLYVCPMHPDVTTTDPKMLCPKCNMRLEPVPASRLGQGGASVPGYAAVELGPQDARLAGFQSVAAEERTIRRAVRAVGMVVVDETRVRRVHSRIEGRIETLFVNFTGQLVRAGQPILSIYSPQLIAMQEELIEAVKAARRFETSSLPEVREGGQDLVRAARMRLELLDVPPDLIVDLQKGQRMPRREVVLNAPFNGYVTSKGTFEGQNVTPETELFTITDMTRVWIEAEIYESEARHVRLGQRAQLALAFDPGRRLAGTVDYIFPTVDPQSRTLRVRFVFPNPDLRLKPGMYADVDLELESARGVAIPDSAVIHTGLRDVVFVDAGGHRYEPREIRTGIQSEGMTQVLSGLAAGEKVVVRANFLLDSESRLRAAIGGAAPPPAPAHDHAPKEGGE